MKTLRIGALLIIVSLMTGCGSTATVLKPMDNKGPSSDQGTKYSIGLVKVSANDVPDHFVAAVKSYLKLELKKNNLLADGGNNRTIDINITNYRMRTGFNRSMFGILAGKDGIKSTVSIKEKQTHSEIGKSEISTYNLTGAGGVDDVARMHAEAIVDFISGEKESAESSGGSQM